MTIQYGSLPRNRSFVVPTSPLPISKSLISRSPLFEKASSLAQSSSSSSKSSGSKIQAWHQKIAQLPEGVRSVTQTFGELVMQDSESLLYSPRYPEPLTQIPRYPRPTDIGQEKMALNLAKRLKKLGLQVQLDEHFNVMGSLKSNLPPNFPHKAKLPVIALKAHLDTTYEQPGKNIIPQLHPQYGGGVLTVSDKNYLGNPVKLDPGDTPALRKRVGEDIITASGDTLLGADAKAGVAEILEALKRIHAHNKAHPQKPLYYPDLRVVFTVDEESNLMGARNIDLKQVGADVAIDLDDTDPGRINVQSYNGNNVVVKIKCRSVHTAELAHMKMASPMLLAAQIVTQVPQNQLLENKSGNMTGYIYLDQTKSNWHEGEMQFLVRDLDPKRLQKRVETLLNAVKKVQAKAVGTPAEISWQVEEEYKSPSFDGRSGFIKHLVQSAKAVGIQPEIATFRGCTDAAIMSERGLPTVILGCGWQNAHQLTEWVSAQDLDRTTNHLVSIITTWPTQGPHIPILNKQQEASGKPIEYQPPLWPKMTRSPNWKP